MNKIVMYHSNFWNSLWPTKDQFVPLQIHKSEQLVLLLAINDHFVPKKHESAFRFHQKKHKEEVKSVLAFQEGSVPKSRKETALKNKMCLKNFISQKGKKPKSG